MVTCSGQRFFVGGSQHLERFNRATSFKALPGSLEHGMVVEFVGKREGLEGPPRGSTDKQDQKAKDIGMAFKKSAGP